MKPSEAKRAADLLTLQSALQKFLRTAAAHDPKITKIAPLHGALCVPDNVEQMLITFRWLTELPWEFAHPMLQTALGCIQAELTKLGVEADG